jgi:protein-S-isoprenylcysteine O-methyltransferase Ste14
VANRVAELALGLYALYLGLAFGLRSFLQWRATGSTGFVGIGGRPGSADWAAGVLFTVALVLGVAGPVLALTDVLGPAEALDGAVGHAIGLILSVAGLVATLYAQIAMGSSWRIGVDPTERTELVTAGPFALVRNPIFAAMIPTAIGLTLLVPSIVALAGLAALVVALELQVRVIEEPYLLRTHGSTYAGYASDTGRFFPGVGLFRPGKSA